MSRRHHHLTGNFLAPSAQEIVSMAAKKSHNSLVNNNSHSIKNQFGKSSLAGRLPHYSLPRKLVLGGDDDDEDKKIRSTVSNHFLKKKPCSCSAERRLDVHTLRYRNFWFAVSWWKKKQRRAK